MDKYIVELLKTSNRIILPELGAFITKKDEPETIVFNEFLKFNDGVFVSYVAEKEAIEKEEALEKTENFVKEIFLELEKGNAHVIKDLGEFQKDEKGKIQFIPAAAKKEKEIPKAEKADIEAAPVTKPEEKADPAEEEKKKAEEKLKEEKKKEKKAAKPPEETVAKIIEEPKELIELEEKEEEVPITEEEAIKAIEEEPPEKKEEKAGPVTYTEKKRSKALMWLLLSLIPVALFVIWFVFLRNGKPVEPDQAILTITEKTEEAVTPQPAVVAEDNIETEEPQQTEQSERLPEEPEALEEVVQPAAAGGKKFYIVAGCFEIEENADNYVTLLRGKGHNPEKFGMIGRLHAVSFHSFSSREEALSELNHIRKTAEPSAWMLYY